MPKYRVFATEKRFYSMEVQANNTLEALQNARKNWHVHLRREDISMRQYTPDEAELIPEDNHD